MKLINPEFLYALGFLVIPILIHLFNFRKYKVLRFSQVQFLQDVQKQTQATSKLKHYLVLLSRLLLLASLVLAFCQPYLPTHEKTIKQGRKGVSIYLDNSFSMQAKAEEGELFQLAKNKALTIVDAYSASDKFQLITNDFESKHQRWLNKSAFIEAIQNVKISPIHRNIAAIIQRQNDVFKAGELIPRRYLISDLQKSSFDLQNVNIDSLSINLLPMVAEKSQNVSLLNLKFNSPYRLKGQQEILQFTAKNFNDNEVNDLSVQFKLNNQAKAPFTFSIPAEDTLSKTFQYRNQSATWQKGKISIKDYPINFDDTLYFSYDINNSIQLLHLFGDTLNKQIKHLFENDSLIHYHFSPITNIDFQKLSQQNFIILDQLKSISSGLQNALSDFVKNGGSVFVIPNQDMDLQSYNNLLKSFNTDRYISYQPQAIQVAALNSEAGLYQDVFTEKVEKLKLPKLQGYWKISQQSRTKKEQLLTLVNNEAFLNLYRVKKGKIYLLTSGIKKKESDFSKHAIFVPTIYNMALQSTAHRAPYHFISSDQITIPDLPQKESPLRIVGKGIDFIPPQKYIQNQLQIEPTDEIKKAGHYELWQGKQKVGIISLNYDRKESDLSAYSIDEVETLAERNTLHLKVMKSKDENLSSEISYLEKGTPLWKYFIIFALAFLAIEVFLLRMLK